LRAQCSEVKTDGHDLDRIIDSLSAEARLGHRGRATNWLTLGLLLTPERFVARAKRSGSLRASRYDFNAAPIRGAVQAVLDASDALNLPLTTIHYLASINRLLTVAEHIGVLQKGLVRELKKSANVALKSLLATIDILFGEQFVPNRNAPTDEWRHYAREELAEAVSYCLYLFNEAVGIRTAHFNHVDERGVLEEHWMLLVVRAATIRAFLEWEILVDSGLYSVEHAALHYFVLRPVDARTEKAIRLGYITADVAKLRELISQEDVKALDQRKAAAHLHGILRENGLIMTIDTPLRRIVMKLPFIPHLQEFLTRVQFFREEAAFLRAAMTSYLLGFEEFLEQKITGSATVWDLLKVWRLFNLLRLTFHQELNRWASEEPELVVRSQLPVFRIADLKSMIEIVGTPQACADIFQLLSWTPTEGKQVVDLQYRPFITAGEYCLVPINVVGESDLVRNALYLSRTRLHNRDTQDPVEPAVARIFQRIGASTASGITYDFQGERGEIDVLAYLDGILFVIECKNSLRPASPFEFRTTLDHVQKGAAQLTRFCELLKTPEFLAYFANRSAFSITNGTQIVTCIVTGNRMMSGAIIDGHPVRRLYELDGFLSNGGIWILGEYVPIIEGNQVKAADVVNYLLVDTVHKQLFDSMNPHSRVFRLGNIQVTVESFALSGEKLAEAFGIASDIEESVDAPVENHTGEDRRVPALL
jgi:hypothetical protein